VRATSGSNFRIISSATAATGVILQTQNAAPVEVKANGFSGLKIATTGAIGLYGATPVARAAAITTPTAPSAAYVQAEAAAMKTAVDAIRVALTGLGVTL